MKHLFFRTLVRIITFFHLERKIKQLRQMDASDLHANMLVYHYGRIMYTCKNPLEHKRGWRIMKDGASYETYSTFERDKAVQNGAMAEETHHNLPCHLCDMKKEGLPCCVCNFDVYFRKVEEFCQHGCKN